VKSGRMERAQALPWGESQEQAKKARVGSVAHVTSTGGEKRICDKFTARRKIWGNSGGENAGRGKTENEKPSREWLIRKGRGKKKNLKSSMRTT